MMKRLWRGAGGYARAVPLRPSASTESLYQDKMAKRCGAGRSREHFETPSRLTRVPVYSQSVHEMRLC